MSSNEHYSEGYIECIEYLRSNLPHEALIGGLEFNIKKYLHRWRYKEDPVKDLRKARDFLTALIMEMHGKEASFTEFDLDKEIWRPKNETLW